MTSSWACGLALPKVSNPTSAGITGMCHHTHMAQDSFRLIENKWLTDDINILNIYDYI